MNKVIFFLFLIFLTTTFSQNSKPPKLVVGVVVDQMCYDYLYRFQSRFSNSGFKKLMSEGVNCRNTHYNYVPTYTAPGHASIYTGTTPSNHKIVANDWYSRELKREVYCVEDTNGKSPFNLKVLTITDQLKLTYPNSLVYSISIKDRSAILPGGHLSDGTFWYDDKTGKIISSNYFSIKRLSWLDDFNNRNYIQSSIEKGWVPLNNKGSYANWYLDSSSYEQSVFKSNHFPYVLKGKFSTKEEYKIFTYLPDANTMLTDLSIELINKQQIGKDETPDFLTISYSSTDILGHAFGPYSHEIEDMYVRLDLEISRLLNTLETKFGKDNFVLFLSADHAVLPVPQMLVDLKLPGGYFELDRIETKLRKAIDSIYHCDFISKIMNNNIYFDYDKMQKNNVEVLKAQQYVKGIVEKWDPVFSVYTSEELKTGNIRNDLWGNMVSNGFDKDLSGDVIFLLDPGFLSKKHVSEESKKGTSHGSPFGYDTQVPLLFYGKNVKHREIFRKIDIIDIVPTLVPILNIAQPSTVTGNPILEFLPTNDD